MKPGPIAALLLLVAWSFACPASIEARETVVAVTVAAGADAKYMKARGSGKQVREETYVFGQGTFYPGSGGHPGLDEVEFPSIAKQLAVGLAGRGFVPTKDQEKADLVITVHWGATKHVERDEVMADNVVRQVDDYLANPSSDPLLQDYARLEQLSSAHDAVSSSIQQGLMENARLLGYTRELQREKQRARARGRPEEPSRLQADLMEERFVVILMAWDRRSLRGKKERQLLWITHCSAPAAGLSFRDALPALAAAGARYFGRDAETLKTVPVEFADRAPPAGSSGPPGVSPQQGGDQNPVP